MKRKFIPLLLAFTAVSVAAAEGDTCRVPPVPQRFVETFLSADCVACWQSGDRDTNSSALQVDWVVPSTAGDDAPLAVAALEEAGARLRGPLPGVRPRVQAQDLPPPGKASLVVLSGLAWNGYLGLSFELDRGDRSWPADASGWVALVERVPAGQDGTPVDRQLVRAVVGPLPLDARAGEHTVSHLRAVRLPPNSQPERLAAVGWVEQDDGRVLLATQSPYGHCEP